MYGTPVRPMSTLTDRLRTIQDRVARIVREHNDLRKRSAELETEARDHQRMCEVLKARVAELERENEVLRKAKPVESGPVDPGTKERIDELVHEIDHCLALLSEGTGRP
jgi:chromosome segregation ATPase